MQRQARSVAPPSQAPQPAPAGMQELTADQLRAIVGGPVIRNSDPTVTTTSDIPG